MATPLAAGQWRGVSIAGAEFNAKRLPGTYGKDYVYPTSKQVAYFASRGMDMLRLPIRWERVQHALYAPLDAAELARIDAVVASATANRMSVVIDLHNYAKYGGFKVGSAEVPAAALDDLWRQLALRYRGNEAVLFGVMNEPVGISAESWRKTVDGVTAAIRATGARNWLLVPGTNWSGAHSWGTKIGTGGSNAQNFATYRDPEERSLIEMHQYLDLDSSGTSPACVDADVGVRRLQKATRWLRSNGKRGFLGEFGAGPDPVCVAALTKMVAFMASNRDVWAGWTYWAGGAWWGDYAFSVEPLSGRDRPQMPALMGTATATASVAR
jgi:endoglucanase